MYARSYSRTSLKYLEKIPKHDAEKIRDTFNELSLNPNPPGSKKLSGGKGLYRVRQGNYRIIYQIDHKAKHINIVLVADRKESYRNF